MPLGPHGVGYNAEHSSAVKFEITCRDRVDLHVAKVLTKPSCRLHMSESLQLTEQGIVQNAHGRHLHLKPSIDKPLLQSPLGSTLP